MIKIKNILILILFSLSIFSSTIIIDKFDRYEISSDNKANHVLIKSDILRFWNEADYIKKNFEANKSFHELGGFYYSSFLPPKITALYYILISEEIFLENEFTSDGKKKLKSNNGKIFFTYLQISLFFFSIILLYNSLKKKIGKHAVIILIFLLIEPTIHQFNFSFFSESIFFSITAILLSLMIKNDNNIYSFFLIGVLTSFLYLQRSISIFYFIPILIFFLLEKKNFTFIISYICGLILVIFLLGAHNYLRTGIAHITPYQSKIDIYLYLVPKILSKKDQSIAKKESFEIKNKIQSFKEKNNLNLDSEKDRIIYGKFIRNLSIKYVINNPIITARVMLKGSFHSLVFNPFEIYSFYKYEYKPSNKDLRYYKSDEHKKFIIIRVLYSLTIYSICIIGFSVLLKKKTIS